MGKESAEQTVRGSVDSSAAVMKGNGRREERELGNKLAENSG